MVAHHHIKVSPWNNDEDESTDNLVTDWFDTRLRPSLPAQRVHCCCLGDNQEAVYLLKRLSCVSHPDLSRLCSSDPALFLPRNVPPSIRSRSKGFLKLAMQYNAGAVPIYMFNENEVSAMVALLPMNKAAIGGSLSTRPLLVSARIHGSSDATERRPTGKRRTLSHALHIGVRSACFVAQI